MNVLFLVGGQWVGYKTRFGTARPTANGFYKKLKSLGLTFTDPALLGDKPRVIFRVQKSNDTAKHIGFYFGHARTPGATNGFTCESGDGTGHVGFHTVQRWFNRCSS